MIFEGLLILGNTSTLFQNMLANKERYVFVLIISLISYSAFGFDTNLNLIII